MCYSCVSEVINLSVLARMITVYDWCTNSERLEQHEFTGSIAISAKSPEPHQTTILISLLSSLANPLCSPFSSSPSSSSLFNVQLPVWRLLLFIPFRKSHLYSFRACASHMPQSCSLGVWTCVQSKHRVEGKKGREREGGKRESGKTGWVVLKNKGCH